MRVMIISKEEISDFNNVETIRWEFQKENANSYWLFLHFKKESEEAKKWNNQFEVAIGFEPKKETFCILDI